MKKNNFPSRREDARKLALWLFAAVTLACCVSRTALAQAVKESPVASKSAKKTSNAPDNELSDSLYMRLLRNDDNDPIAMQTSIVSFRPKGAGKDVVVDLIGAVHVADKSYFKKLNRAFPKYDALLYELVAPKESNVPNGGRSQHPVGQMQQGMKSMLQLAFQLEEIDYRRRNFVHADMSPDEFARVMGEREESWGKMMFKMMGAAMASQGAGGKSSDADLLFALFSGQNERALRLKRVMATQFSDLDSTMGILEGEKGSTIIGMRNKKALDVLDQELKRGKKRIGVFYGAGHLPDMEERMAKRFSMYPDTKNIRWLTAWDMSK